MCFNIVQVCGSERLGCHAGREEFSTHYTIDESKEFTAHRWWSRQVRNLPYRWNPGQTPPEVQNRGISGPTKRTYDLKIFYRPQTKFGARQGNAFTGICLSFCSQRGRGRSAHPRCRRSWMQTSSPLYGIRSTNDGTHPTGMHTCLNFFKNSTVTLREALMIHVIETCGWHVWQLRSVSH